MLAAGGDPSFVEGIDRVVGQILNTSGGRQWWQEVGPVFVHYAEVQEYMEKQGKDEPPLSDLSPWSANSRGEGS